MAFSVSSHFGFIFSGQPQPHFGQKGERKLEVTHEDVTFPERTWEKHTRKGLQICVKPQLWQCCQKQQKRKKGKEKEKPKKGAKETKQKKS